MENKLLVLGSLLLPVLIFVGAILPKGGAEEAHSSPETSQWVLLVHGGAGTLDSVNTPPEKQAMYKASMMKVLDRGAEILSMEGHALDAVEAVIRMLEDDSLFNAGRGAVLNSSGFAELDASIMDGDTKKAGAVAGVTTLKNPITVARAVMEQSKHVMMAGKGAETFAESLGLEVVDPSYFLTQKSMDRYQKMKEHGTVGVVALDMHGNLAAGTSTGGMMMKRYGRIGDSPIIGAGTYADNSSCAVSCTGEGEYFIRLAIAHDVSTRMKYSGASLQAAADTVIMGELTRLGGGGGLIAIDKDGNHAFSFNTPGMIRGMVSSKEESQVKFFKQ